MSDEQPVSTLESFQVLAEQAGLHLQPSELERLFQAYPGLERLKALVRKPRGYNSQPAHIFALQRYGVR